MTTSMTPGPIDSAIEQPTDPGANSDPREARRVFDSASPAAVVAAGVGQLPRLGEMLRDVERTLAQALAILDGGIDPASYPTERYGHLADALFETAGFHLEAALRDVARIGDLPRPPVGSAVSFPDAAPVASGEGPGGPPAPGAQAHLCGHCGKPQRGFAAISIEGFTTRLCHPDEGLDCYRMVTVWGHSTPCPLARCAA